MDKTRLKSLIIAFKLFYREYTVYNLIFTVIGLYFLLGFGAVAWIWIFWIKAFGYVLLATLYYTHRKKFLCFFHNLGASTSFLFASAIASDFILVVVVYSLFI